MKAKTFLPLFTGFYGSHWDEPCFDGEEDYYNLPSDKDFWEFVDWNAYHNHIARGMCAELECALSDFVKGIEFERMSSPKYYNFENDAIHCEIDIQEFKIQTYLEDNRDAFADYLNGRYTSRDGFTSFYSNDVNEWMSAWSSDGSHMVGAVLDFICHNEGIEEPYDITDCHISSFYTDEISQYECEQI
jgi:hypothetical protein